MAKGGGSRQNSSTLLKALEGLTDGLYGMFSKRIELARHEIIHDIQQFGIFIGILIFCGVIILIGYGLLNFAIVFAAAAYWSGPWTMPITAALLAFCNVAIALGVAWYSVGRLQEVKEMLLNAQRRELRRDKKWVRGLIASGKSSELNAVEAPAALPAAQTATVAKPALVVAEPVTITQPEEV